MFIHLRGALCNPVNKILTELSKFFRFLLIKNVGMLKDLNSNKEYSYYNSNTGQEIINSYIDNKKRFNLMYGEYTAPISSNEFYKRMLGPSS